MHASTVQALRPSMLWSDVVLQQPMLHPLCSNVGCADLCPWLLGLRHLSVMFLSQRPPDPFRTPKPPIWETLHYRTRWMGPSFLPSTHIHTCTAHSQSETADRSCLRPFRKEVHCVPPSQLLSVPSAGYDTGCQRRKRIASKHCSPISKRLSAQSGCYSTA